MTLEEALGIVRLLIDRGIARDDAINNPAIPVDLRAAIHDAVDRELNVVLEPARFIVADAEREQWLRHIDRSTWYYWPTLREYLLGTKNWTAPTVRSLDEVTDRILAQLAPPSTEQFDIRGLVLGNVQSGKTANYTAVIAKAADVGYRLIIVLSGIDNGLRLQTQSRLKRELVGYSDHRPGVVRLPPLGHQWHEFTRDELDGDFQPGNANHAALQGSQPVLLVVKKNGHVLRRLRNWLDQAPEEVRRSIPLLVIDDEADQASVDTRGTYQTEDEPLPADYEEPSVINGLIRGLLGQFSRCAYIAYTATPFANILIPHDTYDPQRRNDLYPTDFIVDLPRPEGYFGAEELFGRLDPVTGEEVGGLDVIRHVPDGDLQLLDQSNWPPSLENALLDFVLAGSARAQRGQANEPATMLVHTSSRVIEHNQLVARLEARFAELRDEWRYHRQHGIRDRLRERWELDFRAVTRARHLQRDLPFEDIEHCIGPFFESIQILEVNSSTGSVLDYDREPNLKAIAVGGNRLSRGLTLEGLLVSYFVRRSATYDTLMQMGRWFGFRNGYDDLTRIYTTPELAGWFNDLASVEHQLREDIRLYEARDLTPRQLGMRIAQHPALLVTNHLKQRYATTITIDQSYSGQIIQTVKFPFNRPEDLAHLLERNLQATRNLVQSLNACNESARGGPIWTNVPVESVLAYLRNYAVDSEVRSISLPLTCSYIERQVELGELVRWTVAIKGRESREVLLGEADWGLNDQRIFQIARTRLSGDPNSIGVITSPGDEEEGLTAQQQAQVRAIQTADNIGANPAARRVRPATEGLLLLYPISRHSGSNLQPGKSRIRLYEDPAGPLSRDLIGLAVSFPHSDRAQPVTGQYLVGTVGGWRAVE